MSEDATRGSDAEPSDGRDLIAAGREEARAWKQRREELNLAALAPLPETIGPYKVIRRIGAGGMGVVYEAEQAEPSRRVAVKVVRAPVGADGHHVRLFKREIQVLGRLRHPAIAQIYDAGNTKDGQQYFAMELVDGRPLVEFCELANLSLRDRLRLFAEVCKAVQYAHQRGVIHRDLKPANILVDQEGKPHVLDFGLARVVDPEMDATRSLLAGKALVGTLPYMSPEQTRDDPGDLDIRTDVYSLGVILYEMLTGVYPYDVLGKLADVLHNISETQPARPTSPQHKINDEVSTIVLRALAKERDRRYQSAETLGQDVEHYLNGEPIDAKRDSGLYVLRKALKRYRMRLATGAAFALIVVAACIITATSWHQEAQAQQKIEALEEREHEARRAIGEALPQGAPMPVEAESEGAQEEPLPLADHIEQLVDLVRRLERRQGQAATLAAFITSENHQGAAGYLNEQLGDTPDDAYLTAYRGYLWVEQFRKTGDTALLEEARRDYQRCMVLDSAYAATSHEGIGNTWLLEARASHAEADYDRAISEYSEAISIQPDFLRAYSNRGHAYFDSRDYVLTIADYAAAVAAGSERLSESVPDADRTYCNYGTALRLLGESEKAATQYEQAVVAAPNDVYYDVALALAYLDVGRSAEADACLEVAKGKTEPGRWEEKFVRCVSLDLLPDTLVELAEGSSEKCEAYYYAGEAFIRLGEQESAQRAFEKCLEKCRSSRKTGFNEYRWAKWRLDQALHSQGAD